MKQFAAYRQTAVNSADNVKVVSMLFDGALNFLRISREKLHQGKIAEKGLYIGKTTAIVGELSSSLDMSAGEVAENLQRLYDYIIDRLIHANRHNDLKAYDDAERILGEIRSAWKDMETQRNQPSIETVDRPQVASLAGLRV